MSERIDGTLTASIGYVDMLKGKDGVSPIVKTSKSDGVTTLTITDAEGVKTAKIKDGADGGYDDSGIRKTIEELETYCLSKKPIESFEDVPYTKNVYLNAKGGTTANASWDTTDYIEVGEGVTFNYALTGYYDMVCLLAAYDENKYLIDKVVGASAITRGSYITPAGTAYLRVCRNHNKDQTFDSNNESILPVEVNRHLSDIQSGLDAKIQTNAEAIEKNASEIEEIASIEDLFESTPNMIDESQITKYTGQWYYTPYIPVEAGEKYAIGVVSIYQILEYDVDKKLINTIIVNTSSKLYKNTSSAVYIRISYKPSEGNIMMSKPFSGGYVPYGKTLNSDEEYEFIERSTNNLIDSSKYSDGFYVTTSSIFNPSANCRIFKPVALEKNQKYYFEGQNGALIIKEDYTIVSSPSSPYTPTSDDLYIVMSVASKNRTAYLWTEDAGSSFGSNTNKNAYKYDTFKLKNVLPSDFEQNNSLYGKKWLAIGDSITEGSGASEGGTSYNYTYYIRNRTGCFTTNGGVSNTSIARRGDLEDDIWKRYATYGDDFDYITVFAGTNDHGNNIEIGEWGDETEKTLYGAMKILCEGMLTKWLGKKIGFILPLPKNNGADYSYPNESFTPYINCIEDVCKRYSIPVLDLYRGSGLAPKIETVKGALMPDGLHPNKKGHELISFKIQRFLESL